MNFLNNIVIYLRHSFEFDIVTTTSQKFWTKSIPRVNWTIKLKPKIAKLAKWRPPDRHWRLPDEQLSYYVIIIA